MRHTYKRSELAELVGEEPRRLEFFVREGLFSGVESSGRGKAKLYSRQNAFELLVIQKMRNAGIVLETIKRVLNETRDDLFAFAANEPDRRAFLILREDPDDWTLYHDAKFSKTKHVELKMKGSRAAVVIDLTGCMRDIVNKGL